MKGRKPATTFSFESMIMPRIVVIMPSARNAPPPKSPTVVKNIAISTTPITSTIAPITYASVVSVVSTGNAKHTIPAAIIRILAKNHKIEVDFFISFTSLRLHYTTDD